MAKALFDRLHPCIEHCFVVAASGFMTRKLLRSTSPRHQACMVLCCRYVYRMSPCYWTAVPA